MRHPPRSPQCGKGFGKENEPLLPNASKEWMKWPDLGITFNVDAEDPTLAHVGRFRGDRLVMNWPDRLVKGRRIGEMTRTAEWNTDMPKAPDATTYTPF